jgi:hypothetical protein
MTHREDHDWADGAAGQMALNLGEVVMAGSSKMTNELSETGTANDACIYTDASRRTLSNCG